MFDDLATHFFEHVVRSFEEYLTVRNSSKAGRSRDIHAAINAATPLYHFREHLPQPYGITEAVAKARCPDYGLLGDIGNASKHASLTRGNPQIKNATQVIELLVNTEYMDKLGPFNCVEKVVVVKVANGVERDLLDVEINAINFWQEYLHSIGIINKRLPYTMPVLVQPRSRAECEAMHISFVAVQGLRFHQVHRLQKYNYATKKIEPVDMTTKHLQFTLTKPSTMELEVNLVNESLGKKFRKKVILSPEECHQLSRLIDMDQKQSFLENLPLAQEAAHELMREAGLSPNAPAAQT